MSDNILTGDDLENLLLSWKKKYGTEHLNKQGNPYLKIEKGDMRTAMNALVNTFILKGYSHADLKSNLLSQQIQVALTPHKYDGKLKEWRMVIAQQWKNALNEYFPEEIAEATEPSIDKAEVFLKDPEPKVKIGVPNAAGVIYREDGTTDKVRPQLDRSTIKGLKSVYTIKENDPLAFLKKGKDE
jgi:hypothetical protein